MKGHDNISNIWPELAEQMGAEVGSLIPGPSSRRWRWRQFLSSLHLRISLGRNVTPFWLLTAGLLVVKVLNLCILFSISITPTL